MTEIREQVDDAVTIEGGADREQAMQVLRNPRFLSLFGSQILTQVGGNAVLFGLTVTVFGLTDSSTAVSVLLLTFLVPAVVFGAVAGVFVDMFDRRQILVWSNFLRAGLYLLLLIFPDQLLVIYIVTALVATLTTFFGPAEAAMIPAVVKREQLLTANSFFILMLQASFVIGFALLGPAAHRFLGMEALVIIVVAAYFLAGILCWILPPSPAGQMGQASLDSARRAVAATFAQLREGLQYIRDHHNIFWSLTYLAITASLIGVLGSLGPAFAADVLGLEDSDLVVILLPLGAGLVSGIVILNFIGHRLPRRRLIESGMIGLGLALVVLGFAQNLEALRSGDDISALLVIVVVLAFLAGVCYAFVAVPAQTSLQEELPGDVRGRVFGVLNMLVSLASFVPIIVAGPLADVLSAAAVIIIFAALVMIIGVASIVFAHPRITGTAHPTNVEPYDPMTITTASSTLNRPIRLRYIPEDLEATRPIQIIASPVVPGRAGPAQEPPPGAADG
jgi:MFS family permease